MSIDARAMFWGPERLEMAICPGYMINLPRFHVQDHVGQTETFQDPGLNGRGLWAMGLLTGTVPSGARNSWVAHSCNCCPVLSHHGIIVISQPCRTVPCHVPKNRATLWFLCSDSYNSVILGGLQNHYRFLCFSRLQGPSVFCKNQFSVPYIKYKYTYYTKHLVTNHKP